IRESRNGLILVIHVLGFAELLEVKEEERPVSLYGAAYGETIVISSSAGPGVGLACLEWIARVEDLVDEIVIHGSVKLVGSRCHRDVEYATADLTVFRSIVTRLNRDLLNRINTRLRLCGDTRSSCV